MVGLFHGELIGRRPLLEQLDDELRAGARVVVLWGITGVGKSRLAWESCRRQEGTAALWCDASHCSTATDVAVRLAEALGVFLDAGPLGAALAARGEVLVVIDNCERVIEDLAPLIDEWLREAPRCRMVLTSRLRAEIRGARYVELEPLDLRCDDGLSEAARLLLARGRARDPDLGRDPRELAGIDEVVEQLEGLPLAIELAAVHLDLFGMRGLSERLGVRLELLRAEEPAPRARHLSLQAALSDSWDLLSEREQETLARCSVFVGGFEIAAAQRLVPHAAASLRGLRNQSLVRVLTGALPGRRQVALYESVRRFAAEKLEARDETARCWASHAAYCVEEGHRWADKLDGSEAPAAAQVLQHLQGDLAAIVERHATTSAGLAVEAGLIVDRLLARRGPLALREQLLGRLWSLADQAEVSVEQRISLLRGRAAVALLRGLPRESTRLLQSALALMQGSDLPLVQVEVLTDLGLAAHQRRSLDEAVAHYRAALGLLPADGDERRRGRLLGNLGAAWHDSGDYQDALRFYQQGLALLERAGDARLTGIFQTNLALLLQEQGDLDRAEHLYGAGLATLAHSGDRRLLAIALGNRGLLSHERGDLAGARAAHEQALAIFAEVGDPRSRALAIGRLAGVEAALRRLDRATELLDQATAAVAVLDEPHLVQAVGLNRGFFDLAAAQRASERRGDCLARLEARLLEVQGESRDGLCAVDVCDDVRLIMRILQRSARALSVAAGDAAATPRGGVEPAGAPSLEALVVGPEGRWFRPAGGEWQDLRRRGALRRLLWALVQRGTAGLTIEELRQAGWPDEPMQHEAAVNRVHVALAELRRRGLRTHLQRDDERYYLRGELEHTDRDWRSA